MRRAFCIALVVAATAGCASQAPVKANIRLDRTPTPSPGKQVEAVPGAPAPMVHYTAGAFLGTKPIYLTQQAGSSAASGAKEGGWEARAGVNLRETLGKWTADAGWALVWDYEGDLEMRAGSTFQGDFKAAVAGLFNALPQSIRIRAELRPDNAPPLLYVTRDAAGR